MPGPSSPPPPRYTAGGAALFGLLSEVARVPREAPGLPRGRRAVLRALAAGPPRTVAALAREGELPATTRQGVQRVVDGLARDGLAVRLPNPRHRRAPRIALTEAGRIAAAEDAREEAERLNALARELDPAAVRAAARLLRELHAALAPPSGPGSRFLRP